MSRSANGIDSRRNRRKLIIFFAFLIVISAVAQSQAIRAGSFTAVSPAWIVLIMWSPGLSAIAAQIICERSIRGLGWGLAKLRFLLVAYLVPLLAIGSAYCFAWLAGLAERDASSFGALIAEEFGRSEPFSFWTAIGILATVGFVANALVALGEEIGWRGFLFPALTGSMGAARASLLTGIVWATWHLPGLLWAGYNSGGPMLLSVVCFSATIVCLSVIAGWLRHRSGSVWTGVALHASHNLFVQAVFGQITRDTEPARIVTTEFGVGVAVAYLAAATLFLYLLRRKPNS